MSRFSRPHHEWRTTCHSLGVAKSLDQMGRDAMSNVRPDPSPMSLPDLILEEADELFCPMPVRMVRPGASLAFSRQPPQRWIPLEPLQYVAHGLCACRELHEWPELMCAEKRMGIRNHHGSRSECLEDPVVDHAQLLLAVFRHGEHRLRAAIERTDVEQRQNAAIALAKRRGLPASPPEA